MSNELIQEVEDSLRREKLETLWKEYGPWLIAGAVCAVLLTASVTGWRAWNDSINSRETTELLQAMEATDAPEKLADAAGDLRPGKQAMARITAAGLLLKDKKDKEALAQYKEALKDSGLPPLFRDLATLMAVRIEWSMPEYQDNADEYLAQLRPIWTNAGNPWQWHAHVQTALILAHAKSDFEEARTHLAAVLNAPDLPPSLRERARSLDHLYMLKMTAAENAAAKADPAAQTQDGQKEEPEG